MEGEEFKNQTSDNVIFEAPDKQIGAQEKEEKEVAGAFDLEGQHKGQLSFEIISCFKLALKQEAKLSTGCKVLNDFIRGGFLPKRIYEVYGESGCGKTQLGIQLLF